MFLVRLRWIVLGLLLQGVAAQAGPAKPGVPFTGQPGYQVVEQTEALNQPAFTVAAWVQVQKVDGAQIFISRGQPPEHFSLYLYQGRVRMLVRYQADKYTHANVPAPAADTWVHYVGTYDGQTIKLYVDGRLAAETKASGRAPASTAPLLLGGLADGQRKLHGRLEDVRFYRRALPAAEVAAWATAGAGPTDGLVAQWTSDSLTAKEWRNAVGPDFAARAAGDAGLQCIKDDGYRGIWYFNQPQNDEYVYKYSGGLGTYCSSHNPFAVYRPEVNKTFFCYGGSPKDTNRLLHMVSYYDHATGMVPRPTILLDKRTTDAHDNPVISVDDKGFIWIFSSSHGTARPSFISVSKKPYDIEQFEPVLTTNFSYTQPYFLPGQGFLFLQTLYRGGRKLHFQTSVDGRTWSEPELYAAIEQGHYQVSWSDGKKVACAFNFHPARGGLNYRTNLYYMETADFGRTWRNVQGEPLTLPLTAIDNPARVREYQSQGLNVYVQDLNFDATGRPVVLYTTSRGYESGPQNDPRTWTTAWWNGREWEIRGSIVSDHNYDMGSLYVEADDLWRIIGPTENGPQAYNTGGEIAMWTSPDHGAHWTKVKQLTAGSAYNHGYCRRPVNAHPDFYAIWADGHARQPSPSRLYFCDRAGNVRVLPSHMQEDFVRPEPLTAPNQ